MEEDDVSKVLRQFVDERDWDKFHSQENLAKSISIEAAELLELFQWKSNADRNAVLDELADVLTYCFLLAQKLECTPDEIILRKLRTTSEKYPVEKSKGTSAKYDRL